ncbi:MAG: 50S ribosomal protein L28 [Planctomycetes bacterium]|nr:50S ribosomal protein L28 [Planctomycetota bacterium]
MARVCQVTGKRTRVGNNVSRRGLPKKKGGVGLRITSRTKRTFKPNLQSIRVLDPEGRVLRLKVSTKVIKSGVITLQKGDKTITFPLVKAVRGRNRRALESIQSDASA